MKTLWACSHCRSLNLMRDAGLYVNTGDYTTYDKVSCCQCDYDGHHYLKFRVHSDFDIPDDEIMPKELEGELEYL